MMINLFSSFDPSSFMLPLNWLSTCMFLTLISFPLWLSPSRSNMIWMKITKILHQEFSILIKHPLNTGMTLMFTSMFTFVLMNNFMGLFPYTFTATSHMVLTLTLSLPLWLTFMIYGWMNQTTHMFAHLVPTGTPSYLMPFMVCIETISNVIRPGTLAIRLSANMIAGHLIMTLLGGTGSNISTMLISALVLTQMALLSLEMAVAFIQSYVIAILLTLYSSEVN